MAVVEQELRTTEQVAVPRRPRRSRVNVPAGAGALLWFVVVIVPVYWVVVTSLRTQQNFFGDNPLAVPADPTLDSYLLVFQMGFAQYFVNSGVVTVVAVLLTIFVSLLAAYTIVRNRRPLANRAFSLFLLGLAIPVQSAIIPIFYMITKMGLYDSLTAIILPSAAFAIPITIIIFTSFMRDIPGELFESMRIDGASEWRILWQLVLPLSKPAILTTAIYNGVNVWNNFLFPLVLTQSPGTRTLPLALWTFQGELTINVPAMMAAIVLSALPPLTLYIFGRRQLVAGLTAGFGK
jgi:raffinose/stachyose/melibiose transport system permease protein